MGPCNGRHTHHLPQRRWHHSDRPACTSIPTLSAAVACVGPAEFIPLFAYHVAGVFNRFDDVVKYGEKYLPQIFERVAEESRGGDASTSLYIAGWLQDEDRGAVYCMELWTDESSRHDQIMANSANSAAVESIRSKLIEQRGLCGTPIPDRPLLDAAGFVIRDNDDRYDPEVDLLHLIEVQRHEKIEDGYWVGGKAMLTTINRQGIAQRVLHHWEADEVGKPISPAPMDWKAWRAAHAGSSCLKNSSDTTVSSAAASGLTRQQRRALDGASR
jgi:hypothetical protein